MPSSLRLATRGSDLALWQSRFVGAQLKQSTGAEVSLVVVKTTGDQRQDVRLGDAGAIGLFTAEVQEAVLEGRADFAVHSYKDLPAEQTEGLQLAAVPCREDPRDLLLIRPERHFPAEASLPLESGAQVGTSSARREAFLAAMRPDLEACILRGNVPTRIRKLREGQYDAILVAAAGVSRLALDLSDLVAVQLHADVWPGAPGQGALALECRSQDETTWKQLATLHSEKESRLVNAERELLRALGGGCGLPLGALAFENGDGFGMHAAFGPTADRPGSPPISRVSVSARMPDELSHLAFEQLMAVGNTAAR